MANNAHKKEYSIDKFARHFYCQHARLNTLRNDKKNAKKKARAKAKADTRQAESASQ